MSIGGTPTSLCIKNTVGRFEVVYSNVMEVCQGGPEIGSLSINGEEIVGRRFGGPFIARNDVILIPEFKRKFVKSGFVLCVIDLTSGSSTEKSKLLPLIYLDRVEGNKVYFFEDVDRVKESYVEVETFGH